MFKEQKLICYNNKKNREIDIEVLMGKTLLSYIRKF